MVRLFDRPVVFVPDQVPLPRMKFVVPVQVLLTAKPPLQVIWKPLKVVGLPRVTSPVTVRLSSSVLVPPRKVKLPGIVFPADVIFDVIDRARSPVPVRVIPAAKVRVPATDSFCPAARVRLLWA